MAIAIFIFAIFSALGKFADFLLGEKGRLLVKDRMTSFYVYVGQETWFDLVKAALLSYNQFLCGGHSGLKKLVRMICLTAIFSVPTNLSVMLFTSLETAGLSVTYLTLHLFYWSHLGLGIIVIIAMNFILDFLALCLSEWLSSLKVKSRYLVLLMMIGGAFFTYVVISVSVFFSSIALKSSFVPAFPFVPSDGQDRDLADVLILTFGEPSKLLLDGTWIRLLFLPWLNGVQIDLIRTWYFGLAVALPMTVLVIVLFLSLCLYFTRPVTQGPLMFLLEKLDEAKTGVLTIISSAIGMVLGLLTALQKVLS